MKIPSLEDQFSLVNKGLARVSQNNNLLTFKYKSEVMHKNRWNESEYLMECRGHTYDESTGNLVVLPFRKSFNYNEKDWWSDIDLTTSVVMYKKYNGFMAAVSNGIVSTTGTTNSDFVRMAREYLTDNIINQIKPYTFLYEINHPQDQHIVEENIGAKLLGMRCNKTGEFFPEGSPIFCNLGQALNIAKHDRGEGYMIYQSTYGTNTEYFCKVKSDRYRARKYFIRMNDNKTKVVFDTKDFKGLSTVPSIAKLYCSFLIEKYSANDWINLTGNERFTILSELEQQKGF